MKKTKKKKKKVLERGKLQMADIENAIKNKKYRGCVGLDHEELYYISANSHEE